MDKVLSIRRNSQIFSLFATIQEYQNSANRTEIINVAIQRALEDRVNGLKWTEIAVRVPGACAVAADFPAFIQLRVDAEQYGEIVAQIREDFNLTRNSPASFVVKLLLINYVSHLESQDGGRRNFSSMDEDLREEKEARLAAFRQMDDVKKLDAIYELLLELRYKL